MAPYCNMTGPVRFYKRTNKNGPVHPVWGICWMWTGPPRFDGYGAITVNCKHYTAHRYSWTIHRGPIPEETQVLHHCDIPLCVNPNHLFLGTCADNKLDCCEKDRHARGERHGESKLTDENVREIRRLYRFGVRGRGAVSLARMFGVAKPTILGIVKRTMWKHVV